ncbi:MAG: hypothetical protein IPG45_19115 [Deltaproteobacteria bacterium]|nr:hypothetical protein [Deltaproteobacteria bacterium]
MSRRPLGMPAGEHRFVVALGTYKPGGGLASDGTYYWGITDQLQYQFPLLMTYGGPVADNLELRGRFGLVGIGGGGSQTSRYFRVDPRYDYIGREEVYTQWTGGVVARTTLGELAALVLGVDSSMFVGAHLYRPGVMGRGVFILDIGPRLSASVGVAAGLSAEFPTGQEDYQVGVVQIGSVGDLEGRPTVAVHLFDQLDLVGFISWRKSVEAEEGVLRGTAGIDWHFD